MARIYPVYLLGLAVGIGPLLWQPLPAHAGAMAAATLSLTQAWLPLAAHPFTWDGPGWSLSEEALFYTLFPLLAVPIGRLTVRQMSASIPLIWAAALALPLAYLALNPDRLVAPGAYASTYWLHVVLYFPPLHLPEFLLGAVVGRLFVLHRAAPLPLRLHRALEWGSGGAALGCLVILAGVMPYAPLPPTFNGLFDPVYALLIYVLAWGHSRLAAGLAHPALIALGEASYALYILHWPLWDWLRRIDPPPVPSSPLLLLYGMAYLFLALCVSLLAYHWIERPARHAIRGISWPVRRSRV